MVRKAETLKQIGELDLSPKTRNHMLKRFATLDAMIWNGRVNAYSRKVRLEASAKNTMACEELVDSLEKAGFIRHDISEESFRVNAFYKTIYGDVVSDLICSESDLFDIGKPNDANYPDFQKSNVAYEEFACPSEITIEKIRTALRLYLSDSEYNIISYRYGFNDTGECHRLTHTANYYHISNDRVRQIELRAIRRLKRMNKLPAILASTNDQKAEVSSIISEIEEIHKDPLYAREAELFDRLHAISKKPFDYANIAKEYLASPDSIDIAELNLMIRTYNCLKRAGVNTVFDILKLTKHDWSKIRNLGGRGLDEVEEKMRMAGFTNFSARE